MSTRQRTRPNYKCLHDLILLINLMSGAIPKCKASHATRVPTGMIKIQCLQGKPTLVTSQGTPPLNHHLVPIQDFC